MATNETALPVEALSDEEIASLNQKLYNATVTKRLPTTHPELMRMRVRLDDGIADDGPALHYQPGQYTTLGMGYWEPRTEGAQQETLDAKKLRRVVKRAYSISCRLLDEEGAVSPAGDENELEFYVALVLQADSPPALTPRLFLLKEGDRLHMGPRPKGTYTLESVQPTDNLLLAATGTGEAPHNAMVSKLLADGHQGKITSITCARYQADLGYVEEQQQLMKQFPNYRYVSLTTREPENLDKDHPNFVGVTYIQHLLEGADTAERLGFDLDSEATKVFLCGNPAMIGIPNKPNHPDGRYPGHRGVVQILEEQGFQANEPKTPGNIHFEKYW